MRKPQSTSLAILSLALALPGCSNNFVRTLTVRVRDPRAVVVEDHASVGTEVLRDGTHTPFIGSTKRWQIVLARDPDASLHLRCDVCGTDETLVQSNGTLEYTTLDATLFREHAGIDILETRAGTCGYRGSRGRCAGASWFGTVATPKTNVIDVRQHGDTTGATLSLVMGFVTAAAGGLLVAEAASQDHATGRNLALGASLVPFGLSVVSFWLYFAQHKETVLYADGSECAAGPAR